MTKKQLSNVSYDHSLRYGLLVPLTLMIASFIAGCLSYSEARQSITDDLNEAMIAMVNKNCQLWTRTDTIAALRKMHETTHKPMIYQAYDADFRNDILKDEAYFTLALVDDKNVAPKMTGNLITSDSILLIPKGSADGIAIHVQGFAGCSIASVFAVSDQTLPGVLLSLSILSMTVMVFWRRRQIGQPAFMIQPEESARPTLDGIKLTPMQRQLAQMLLEAPGHKVDKATLCTVLWDGKSNAEESLYTLVRRTKTALADAGIEIVCNRGDSYELHINA